MSYTKPEIYTDADWQMVLGYMRGNRGLGAERNNPAYMHGYRNGLSDFEGFPHERAEVLRRRASMIPGISPQSEIISRAMP